MNNTRLCPRCKQGKPIADFTFTTGRIHSWCRACRNKFKREWTARQTPEKRREAYLRCALQRRETERRHRAKLKRTVLAHYSKNTMQCAHCSINDIRILCIDHIDGGGYAHRKAIGKANTGTGFYKWLIKNDYPSGFQVLCYNCNMKKRWEQQEYGVRE